jgi:phosphatidylinositol-3-phosphatase
MPRPMTKPNRIAGLGWLLALVFCATAAAGAAAERVAKRPGEPPRPDHVVIVIEENKTYAQIIGSTAAPYINRLANDGALFTNAYAISHPSQPNYLALFSGSTHDVPDNRCPLRLSGENLASALAKKSLSFGIYSESMPSAGFEGCASAMNYYARKHNPAVNWQGVNVAPSANLPFDRFPSDFSRLPTVSMVIPNQTNDMHDGASLAAAIAQGDSWLASHLDAYVQWARTHNSLLVLTWDEDDDSADNHIATVFAGAMVKRGKYGGRIDHYSVLRTLADMYGLQAPGKAAQAAPVGGIWSNGEK